MAEKSDNGKSPLAQGTPRTVLFPDSSISGKLSCNLPIKIDSRFSGEIKASDLLVVGANAQVDAHISARQLQVEGKLVGNVQVVGCFEIMPGGQFRVSSKSESSKFTLEPYAKERKSPGSSGWSCSAAGGSFLAIETRCLAGPFTQIIEFGAAHFAARYNVDFINRGECKGRSAPRRRRRRFRTVKVARLPLPERAMTIPSKI